ncbi:hypothetical protein FIV06_26065 [Labrenzia sp. THAF191b]|nr:hypothetical protein FIV06_26065 [Labrenzia sp. THAF191b]QFT07237.1 hypothetical protein FIV05_26060 [Labrenzia sp. THAF191a]QFT18781.1 hypothetical protein FIV03_26075 [Labrenzia sp. THAF187b]
MRLYKTNKDFILNFWRRVFHNCNHTIKNTFTKCGFSGKFSIISPTDRSPKHSWSFSDELTK